MSYFNDYLSEVANGLKRMIVTDAEGKDIDYNTAVEKFADRIHEIKSKKGLIFFCGNGASCSMAEHMSHDFFQNAEVNTQTCAETSHITAISNDVSYEDVFAYRIARIMGKEDTLFTISSSGNSPNIVKAINTAKNKGSFAITLSGKSEDNKSRNNGDLNFYIPMETYGLVESAHAVLIHALLDFYLDKYMGGRH